MKLNQIIPQLNDLPTTFRRFDTTYPQLIDSVAVGFATYTDGADEISVESNSFASARYGWLDVWGLLFNIPRNSNEADYNYRNRIHATLLAWVGTLPAIVNWGQLILNQSITVTENDGLGYVISVSSTLSPMQLAAFVQSLARIRPAGVPFQLVSQTSSLYLDTINFLDSAAVVGAYLIDDLTSSSLSAGASTNNALPMLPSFYLDDPTLNPSQ